MNKIFVVLLLMSSVVMVGCDRASLDGLNLKINAEVNSDYDDDDNDNEDENDNENESNESQSSQFSSEKKETAQVEENQEAASNNQYSEASQTQSAQQNNTAENDPDAPMAFREIPECSKAGITAKTNEIFYADNPQVKSIDSKNQKQVKKWESIYAEVERECQ